MSQFVLIFNGPTCSGKSTTAKFICARQPRIFRASTDRIKRLISDYSPKKHQAVVRDLVLALADQALTSGLSVLMEGYYFAFKDYYKDLAAKHGCRVIEVNFYAPAAVLEQRFLERVAKAKAEGGKISVDTIEGLREHNLNYEKYKNDQALTFDSSLMTVEEIYQEIIKLL